jgi:hypothetical protein
MKISASLRPAAVIAAVMAAAMAMMLAPAEAQAEPGVARVVVVVGANAAAPGRQRLVYGHRDAEKVADALVNVGGFRRQDVEVLRDPAGAALMAALGRAIAKLEGQAQSLLYFYYSGHSDERALYPGGQALPLDDVRALIDGAHVSVRIGMVDACRGGGWTRAKGLVPAEPFAVHLPMSLDNEGSVLISSSSGLENAHESDQLQGSFFTHHFVMGLRGGADRDGNGEVTLNEAFEYAKEHTIRDSLRMARETQHPSYAVNLRGRRDLVLANVNLGQGASTVELGQQLGPLELVHVESGVSLLELQAGVRRVRLAVPPGRYLVRKQSSGRTLVKEVRVEQGQTTRIDEGELALVGTPGLAIKGPAASPVLTLAEAQTNQEVPQWVKVGALTSGLLAAVAWAGFVKFRMDADYYNKRLDPFRRFPCGNGASLCDKDGQPALELTAEQQQFVTDEMGLAKDKQSSAWMALGAAAALTVTTGVFAYGWIRGSGRPRNVAVNFVPLGPSAGGARLGLAAVGRF